MTGATTGTAMFASSRISRIGGEAGQALVELLITLPILVVLVAMAYQLFRAHQSVVAALIDVHQTLFMRAFERNCADASPACQYSSDPGSEGLDGVAPWVTWDPTAITGVRLPVLRPFDDARDGHELVIASNRPSSEVACGGFTCKHTRLGAGTYMPWIRNLQFVADMERIDLDQAVGLGQGLANDVFDSSFNPKQGRAVVDAGMRIFKQFNW
jgi:hypothetical protein